MKPKERSLTWTRTLYLFVALVLVSLSLILLSEGRQLQPVESVLNVVFGPIRGAVPDPPPRVGGWIDPLRHMPDLEGENAKLRTPLASVTAENARLQELQRDN